MRTKVKICGLTNLEDALCALRYGADFLGFNFYEKSSRYITPPDAAAIVRALPAKATCVGIFVNKEKNEVEHIARTVGLQMLQFHGDEDLSYLKKWGSFEVIKALRVKPTSSLDEISSFAEASDYLLFDSFSETTYGGTGKEIPHDMLTILANRFFKKAFLAGGLSVHNVKEKIKLFSPFAVDVASGVEIQSRKKDEALIKKFIEETTSA